MTQKEGMGERGDSTETVDLEQEAKNYNSAAGERESEGRKVGKQNYKGGKDGKEKQMALSDHEERDR